MEFPLYEGVLGVLIRDPFHDARTWSGYFPAWTSFNRLG